MRTILYWLTATAIAVLAARATDHPVDGGSIGWSADTEIRADILPVPEPSRAVLLGIGIMAIAFTYRRAWLNLKRKD